MNERQTKEIRSQSDIILARMRVRELARARGFSMVDQARISLAASSLANALGLGRARHGQIVVDCLSGERGTGVRVVCRTVTSVAESFSPGALGDTRWIVDELTVERLSSNKVQVTAVKWDGGVASRFGV